MRWNLNWALFICIISWWLVPIYVSTMFLLTFVVTFLIFSNIYTPIDIISSSRRYRTLWFYVALLLYMHTDKYNSHQFCVKYWTHQTEWVAYSGLFSFEDVAFLLEYLFYVTLKCIAIWGSIIEWGSIHLFYWITAALIAVIVWLL